MTVKLGNLTPAAWSASSCVLLLAQSSPISCSQSVLSQVMQMLGNSEQLLCQPCQTVLTAQQAAENVSAGCLLLPEPAVHHLHLPPARTTSCHSMLNSCKHNVMSQHAKLVSEWVCRVEVLTSAGGCPSAAETSSPSSCSVDSLALGSSCKQCRS